MPCSTRGKPVRRAIDQSGEPRGRGDVVEPEEGEDAVDVHEKCGRLFGGGHGVALMYER
jgi:hypothetical protein